MFLLQRSWLFFCLALMLWQVTNPSRILDCISLGTPFLSGTPYFCIFGSGLPGYLSEEEIGQWALADLLAFHVIYNTMMFYYLLLIQGFRIFNLKLSDFQFYRCSKSFVDQPTVSSVFVESFSDKHLPQVFFTKINQITQIISLIIWIHARGLTCNVVWFFYLFVFFSVIWTKNWRT